MTAASPGIVASAMENQFYDTLDEYVGAVSAALAFEYRTIVDRGLLLQIDAPDLALERHTLFADRPLSEFLHWVEMVVGAINSALQGIDPSMVRLHVCWGNYEGPHTHDVDFATSRRCCTRHALARSCCRWRTHATRTSTTASRIVRCRTDKVLVAGVIDTTSNYVEHPQVVADRLITIAAQRSAIRAGSSPAPTAASTRRPASATWPRHSSGPSCARSPPAQSSRRRSSTDQPSIDGLRLCSAPRMFSTNDLGRDR